MKKLLVAIAIGFVASTPTQALTLNGGVERTDVEGRIGVRVSTGGQIMRVHPGSPADKVGLKSNDQVVMVDGKHNAIRQIAGEPGTQVQLDVKRGMRRFQVAVTRLDTRTVSYE